MIMIVVIMIMMMMVVVMVSLPPLEQFQRTLKKRLGELLNLWGDLEHPDHTTGIEIRENTEKSPGELSRLTIIQAPEKANSYYKREN